MATKIVTKNSSTAGSAPSASDLVQGELAVNVVDKRLYTEDNAGNIVELGTNPLGEITANGGIALGDNDKATFGASDDLQIYHDGSASYIKDLGTGPLAINTNGSEIMLTGQSGSEYMVRAIQDGAVELFYDANKKLATTATGTTTVGTATMDGLTVDGSATIDGGATDNTVLTLDSGTANTYLKITDSNSTAGAFIGATTNDLSFYPNNTLSAKFASGGDISFYEDTGTTAKMVWDASAESLGIGQGVFDSTQALNLKGEGIAIKNDKSGNNNNWSIIRNTGTLSASNISFVSGAGEAMVIDHNMNVGIGTSSPDTLVHAYKASNAILKVAEANGYASLQQSGTNSYLNNVASGGSLIFRNGTAPTERMRIDASGNVGIGTSSPTNGKLQVVTTSGSNGLAVGTATQGLFIKTTGTTVDYNSSGNSSGEHAFSTGNTERMRIDSSGHLLVATTDDAVGAGNTNTGISLRGGTDNRSFFSASANYAMHLNRNTSDGEILYFAKDGTAVGSIGTSSGSMYIEGNPSTGKVGLTFYGSSIEPRDAGSPANAVVDLGGSATRFKDLYLSGGVYLGGTGAANKLEDYESGTWTPTVNGVSGTLFKNSYVKVGNQVTVTAFFSSVSWNAGANTVDNLPFTNGYGHASIYSPSNTVVIQQATVDGTQIKFRAATGGSSAYLLVSATYIQD